MAVMNTSSAVSAQLSATNTGKKVNTEDEMSQQAFLTLFTTQLQNQNPLDPVKNEAFVAQLAQFSQLEATTKMADSLASMSSTMQGDRLIDARFVTVNLLGAPCRVPAGPWLLAALAQVPVIVVGCFKEDGHTFRVVCAPPMECKFDRKRDRDAQIQEWAQQYADHVGAWVHRWPLQWYNFHDLWTQEPPAEQRVESPAKVAGIETTT